MSGQLFTITFPVEDTRSPIQKLLRRALRKDGVKIHITKKPWWRRRKNYVRIIEWGSSFVSTVKLPETSAVGTVFRFRWNSEDERWETDETNSQDCIYWDCFDE